VQFDGTANGLQHLAFLGRDADAAVLLNLLPPGAAGPQDVYSAVRSHVEVLLGTSNADLALLWRKIFEALDGREKRKFVKAGVMTYPYGVTENGMIGQVGKAYRERFDEKAPPGACKYLAQCIQQAVKDILPHMHKAREYICKLSAACIARGKHLHWVSPSGFPFSNIYQLSDVHDVRTVDGGRLEVADGVLEQMDDDRAIRAAAPNFVHSLDASHLIRSVLAARESGITDILTVHDCFAVRAGDAARFLDILHRELFLMYVHQDWLGRLRAKNGIEGLPPPEYGDLDLEGALDTLDNEYSFS
jgi:DNA-directed RNA polymerase